jgi:imidazole glycerol phosphate synthase subunit HisF
MNFGWEPIPWTLGFFRRRESKRGFLKRTRWQLIWQKAGEGDWPPSQALDDDFDWARRTVDLGAGEILLTSMRHDGTRNGFAVELTRKVAEIVSIPVIASGGAGKIEHFAEIFTDGKADAGLAASIFHFQEIQIPVLKDYLRGQKITVR